MRQCKSSPLMFLALSVVACELDDGQALPAEFLVEDAVGEGPWIGGMFEHRLPPLEDAEDESSEPPGLAWSDSSGSAEREVIVLLASGANELGGARILDGVRAEDALVAAIREDDSDVLARFGDPVDARRLVAGRSADSNLLAPEIRSAEDRLQRYVVMRYADAESARRAVGMLERMRSVEYVSLNEALGSSALPNDPYVPFKPVVAQYQWGMHAMGFPITWELTPGTAWLGAADGGVVGHDDLQNVRSHLSFTIGSVLAAYAIHGTHVAGILAATYRNAVGVAGACPSCSVVMGASGTMIADRAAAISGLVDRGVQVINMSFGSNGHTCANAKPVCDAITVAQGRDVLLVAAAGNYNKSAPDFPASVPGVLAVGGVQNSNPAQIGHWQPWFYNSSNASSAVGLDGVLGPARSIVSTMAPSAAYNSSAWVKCGDTSGFDESGTFGDGYGSCTGTSMATPHVAGLGGILRSINPRLSAEGVKSIIRQSSNYAASVRTPQLGYGLPHAYLAAQSALNGATNRLTPLFAFYSAGRLDYFYTAAPQMASAAIVGRLQPGVGTNPPGYTTVGSGITGYASYPGISPSASRTPRAQAWIFTTPTNPKSASVPLAPLYRLSWKCGDPGESPVCPQNPSHTDFVYTAEQEGVDMYSSWGYRLDGIEGYIYPKSLPKPAGTVRLMRKYNPARDDHAIFPETELATMQSQGYTTNSGSDWLGYVYPNTGGTPSV